MKDARRILVGKCPGPRGERGTATLELAIVLPLLLVILFTIVDIGRLLDARMTVAKLAQHGALLGSRDLPVAVIPTANPVELITLLQNASSLDLVNSGKIYFWQINGATSSATAPVIATANSGNTAGYGALTVNSSIGTGTGYTKLGLTDALYTALSWDSSLGMAPLAQITVVEVFYRYQLITPLVRFVRGFPVDSGGGYIVSSKALIP
ncbi:TadE/TadG family type IV pilus assembly protein [uncultured Thiodictyon sp.]|uniref:TadE/TadG family type IV pilus assembly protein n=1 Tax=uncultured Thiodictyon sp. TaxID=1846217 RepID=UPI0025F65836|nr:TadE/TadG family type IV pilus assembly protein [uncultured Thiodictyon sp.]